MRILFIRHGDPDYENDTLTEKGCREADLLAQRASSLRLGECCVSPLGRAQRTAQPCLEITGINATTLDWLQEFPAKLDINKARSLKKHIQMSKKMDQNICQESCGICFLVI